MKENNNKWILSGKKPAIGYRIILILILAISLVVPIISTIAIAVWGVGFNIGILITYAIFWGSGFFLLRAFLWNSYGQEILTIENEKIVYVADYKYFKDGKQEVNLLNATTEIIYEDTPNHPVGRLRIKNDKTTIETVLQIKIIELKEIEKEIKTHYNKL